MNTTTAFATARLDLLPAQEDHLDALSEGDAVFSAEFGYQVAPGFNPFAGSIEYALEQLRCDRASPRWWSYLFIHRQENTVIGIGGYKGDPVHGTVEIGYAIAPDYRRQNFAVEAAQGLVDNAFTDPAVDAVIAHTLAEPGGSTRVLESCGFQQDAEIEDAKGKVWRWRLDRADHAAGAGHQA